MSARSLMLRGQKFCKTAFLSTILLFLASACTGDFNNPDLPHPNHHTLVFMTDFGTVDDSVAICKGVMLGIDPELKIIDLTHQVTPYSILDGARFLAGAAPYYGTGTVFVVVIDP